MDTKLKGLWEKVKGFFKNMSKKMRIILGAGLAVIVIAVAVLAVWMGNKPYTQLYQDLTAAEASEVMSYLQNNGITDFQVTGTSIMVRSDQYASLLAQLAMAGYPKNGSLYETYWEHVGTMSTSSEQARAFLISTQEKLETSIRSFPDVLDVQVYITPGEDRTYVLQDASTETTAAVHLDLRSGCMLTDGQADAIRRLVSHAWSGMTIDSVVITDGVGNTYNGGSASASDAADLKRYWEEYEANKVRTAVKEALDSIFGSDNVKVSPNVTVDVNHKYIESTTYHQPDGSYENGGLIGSELGQYYITRDGLQPVGGTVGTTTNSDIPTYVEDLQQTVGDEDSAGYGYEKNNKIDETHEQAEILAPTITDVTVAVTINENASNASSISVEQLQSHVAFAAGIGGENPEQRVSVLVAPFPTPVVEPDEPVGLVPPELMPYLIIAAAALLLLIILLIVILSVRRKKRKKQEEEDQKIIAEQLSEMAGRGSMPELGITPEMAEGILPPPTGGADIMDINTEKSMELRKNVRQFVQNNPEVAAAMLKTWLKGGDDSSE